MSERHVDGADGVWAPVGRPTGLRPGDRWELDVVAEGPEFGAQMEAMFEVDLANAREIRLAGGGQRPSTQPERLLRPAERAARHHTQGRKLEGRTAAVATLSPSGRRRSDSGDALSKHGCAVTRSNSELCWASHAAGCALPPPWPDRSARGAPRSAGGLYRVRASLSRIGQPVEESRAPLHSEQ